MDNEIGIRNAFPAAAGRSEGHNGGEKMASRITKLETEFSHITNNISEIKNDIHEIKRDSRTDFRLTFSAIIMSVSGLAALMAKGFHWF